VVRADDREVRPVGREVVVALSEADKQKVGLFLGALLRGTADLGFAALPLVKLYSAAKTEKLNFTDLLMRDPETALAIVTAMRRQAKKLPPEVVSALEQVVAMARS
jgi:hypothetical protein